MIPLYLPDGRLYQHIDPALLFEHRAHFKLVTNKRGNVTRAYLKATLTCDTRPNSTIGMAFEQQIASGNLWALQGVRGS